MNHCDKHNYDYPDGAKCCWCQQVEMMKSESPAPSGSVLTEDLARAAWSVLAHDLDPNDPSDPCFANNWRALKAKIGAVLRAHKIKH